MYCIALRGIIYNGPHKRIHFQRTLQNRAGKIIYIKKNLSEPKVKPLPFSLALHKSFILWWGCFEAVEHSFKNDTDEVSKKDDADEDSKKDDDPKDVEFLFRGPL